MDKPLLELRTVAKQYISFHLEVSLSIRPGELVSILGPSGSGKTTTLRVIAGFEKPDTGKVFFEGRDISIRDPSKRKFGFVPQDYIMFPHLDVEGNVAYGPKVQKTDPKAVKKRVSELLGVVGLGGYARRSVHALSGGERQRVAIARALAINPGLLLLDEPFSALDTPLRRELREEILNIKRELGIAILFVTHSQEEALSISDRVLVMRDGVVVQRGAPSEIFKQPTDDFVARFVGSANLLPIVCMGKGDRGLMVQGERVFTVESTKSLPKGEHAKLMIRPHCLYFAGSTEMNAIPATIRRRQFFGHYYEYTCQTPGSSLSVVGPEFHEVGDDTWIAFRPADVVLLPEKKP
ncbi:MAG: Fe3+/spermidine/putrescine ABC transporter ATP-binding protein [Spirochaetales bacterium]|nr:Fe3+/spermidine/putrescine ABC transporter ATP-binding protein [Spirochaetales bacterium]